MDREIVAELRAANEACMTLLTLMSLDDDCVSAAELVAEDDRYAQRTTCMALAGFAISAASALAEATDLPLETILQAAATNAALHTVELEEFLDEGQEDEGHA
jgi:hypothetical protein